MKIKTIKKRFLLLLMLLLFISLNMYGGDLVPFSAKTWGLTAQVSSSSSWIGGVIHLGPYFMIRPGIFTSGAPSDNWSLYGLKSDFLFTIHRPGGSLFYFGPGISELFEIYFDGNVISAILEISIKSGVQIMINRNFGFYTDIGISIDGEYTDSDFTSGEYSPGYIIFRNFGLGAVFYL